MSEEITSMTEAAEQTPLDGQMEPAEASADPAGLAAEAGNAEANAAGAVPAAEQPAGTEPPADDAQAQEKPTQDPEVNRAFAQRRREQEMFQKLFGDVTNPVTGKPFSGLDEFGAWKEKQRVEKAAKQAGLTAEEYAALEAQIAQKVKESDPEVLHMRTMAEQLQQAQQRQVFQKDLAEIRAAYPDEKAEDVAELGEEYLAMMATGKVSAIAAYEAVRAHKQRSAPKAPSMGDVGGSAGKEKEFFTREEVLKMTQAEVSQNFEKIRKSQAKW